MKTRVYRRRRTQSQTQYHFTLYTQTSNSWLEFCELVKKGENVTLSPSFPSTLVSSGEQWQLNSCLSPASQIGKPFKTLTCSYVLNKTILSHRYPGFDTSRNSRLRPVPTSLYFTNEKVYLFLFKWILLFES